MGALANIWKSCLAGKRPSHTSSFPVESGGWRFKEHSLIQGAQIKNLCGSVPTCAKKSCLAKKAKPHQFFSLGEGWPKVGMACLFIKLRFLFSYDFAHLCKMKTEFGHRYPGISVFMRDGMPEGGTQLLGCMGMSLGADGIHHGHMPLLAWALLVLEITEGVVSFTGISNKTLSLFSK